MSEKGLDDFCGFVPRGSGGRQGEEPLRGERSASFLEEEGRSQDSESGRAMGVI